MRKLEAEAPEAAIFYGSRSGSRKKTLEAEAKAGSGKKITASAGGVTGASYGVWIG